MLYNKPRTIEAVFSEAATDTVNGKNVKWHQILVMCGLIDADKSNKKNVVCVTPSSEHQHNDLKQKTEWLRRYYTVDPLITTVVNKMDDILKH